MLCSNTIEIIAVGKNKNSFISDGIDDYCNHIKKYCSVQYHYLKEVPGHSIQKRIQMEGQSVLSYINSKKNSLIISLTEHAKCTSSAESALKLKQWMNTHSRIIFIIGGPYGLSEDVIKQSDFKLSLSPMTFNHQLVRIILAEQIYRCLTIIYGNDYHH